MEQKIGEIFEINGEWYQCVEHKGCHSCAFALRRGFGFECVFKGTPRCTCRSDGKLVIFKKLEKVGEPYMLEDKKFQKYKVFKTPYIYHKIDCSWQSFADPYYISLEIKQTKEDMEETKLIELLSEKVHNAWMKEKEAQGFSYGKDYDKEKKKHPDMLPYNELKEEVKEYDRATVRAVLQAQKELQSKYNYNNLKSFDLEAAKAGKPVCTRDGRKARIICFDSKNDPQRPIVALVEHNDNELLYEYTIDGKDCFSRISTTGTSDLMMLPEKKEGYVNIYRSQVYDTLEKAKEAYKRTCNDDNYFQTIKIEWEE